MFLVQSNLVEIRTIQKFKPVIITERFNTSKHQSDVYNNRINKTGDVFLYTKPKYTT